MIRMTSIKDIQDVYQGVLRIRDPQDIDIEAIAYLANATVCYRPLQGCEARIVGKASRAVITVKHDTIWSRQRFSIGHELGHWFRDRGLIGNLCTKADITSNRSGPRRKLAGKETIANRFASELLMPTFLFNREVGAQPPSYDLMHCLKRDFQVSQTAAAIRCLDCCDYPAILICAEGGRRAWFHTSPLFPGGYFPRTLFRNLPNSTVEVMDADDWLEGAGIENYTVNAQTWEAGDARLMALLWWDQDWSDEILAGR